MSMPLDQLQQPPPSLSYTHYSRHGSVGPVIAVLAVIAILGTLAAIVGRLCSGRRIMGHGQYDIESWLEEKCSSCIDGRVNPPPLPSADISAGSVPLSIPIHTQEETKPDEPSSQNPRPKGGSWNGVFHDTVISSASVLFPFSSFCQGTCRERGPHLKNGFSIDEKWLKCWTIFAFFFSSPLLHSHIVGLGRTIFNEFSLFKYFRDLWR